ncbi:hypothetical protein BMF77_04706 [Dolichospermum sp. UHCC 0315A]|uniref:hypothetical protein n=1 Tax=Dolichospermum TaxID=748770 RepID=UPI0011E68CF3|nr:MULTISPECIES: hypothetical protein [Dolichospermum]MBO1047060.1 hypothetical protein [Dolichospermum sp. DEX182a]MDB9436210.1 hypothetical protein [Dolichospermum lemmermannii CS-548]QEI44078.1 hypothetical protein BMF77_04706 [Dolichospermum sp. UHCC 0315A]QSV61765.1 MAG: hypothetical protein HEQ26_02325 [Dolichospermum sp. DL01]
MNNLQKSAFTLVIQPEEKIENRVYIIVNYLAKTYLESQWLITEIDATGLLGNRLTSILNNQENTTISSSDFLQLLQEEGQILDLEATLVKSSQEIITVFIRDGYSVDILGVTELLPVNVLNNCIQVDANLFDTQETEISQPKINVVYQKIA